MHLLFCHETFYSKKRDGTVLSYGAFPYDFWQTKFLNHFESVTVIGRKKKLSTAEEGHLDISSGKNIDHVLLPDIYAPVKRITKQGRMYKKIAAQVKRADALIIRGPVEFGMMAAQAARAYDVPYAVEMCGCAYDKEYFKGDLFNKVYAPIKYRRAKTMVQNANAVIYVTQNFLQQRYPTSGQTEYASNVEISMPPPEVLDKKLQRVIENSNAINLGLIGNFENGLKGVHVAIEALGIVQKMLDKKGAPASPVIRLKILGQGIPAIWASLLNEHGIKDKVDFCGRIPGKTGILEWLDDIDIFLKPGFHEGLPRPLIEAMSRGCAALSSDTGETDDLLSADFIHPRGDAQQLSKQIIALIDTDKRKQAMRDNFEKAKDYTHDISAPRREEFWNNFVELVRDKKSKRP